VPEDKTATDPDTDPAGVFGDESDDAAAGANEAPNDEITGVLEGNKEDTGVSHNRIEEAPTNDNQPSEDDGSDEEDEFH
jgi:hypothetical protein